MYRAGFEPYTSMLTISSLLGLKIKKEGRVRSEGYRVEIEEEEISSGFGEGYR